MKIGKSFKHLAHLLFIRSNITNIYLHELYEARNLIDFLNVIRMY